MQICSIRLKNIKSHRDSELHFAPGINVLSGPNGIGKSTVFEAIGYALFGVDAQSFVGNAERFIAIGSKKGEVEVEFEPQAGQRYRVKRTVGAPAKWLLSQRRGAEFEVEEHKDAKETEARLKELLGLDNGRSLAEQFELVIGPFQHDFLGPFVIKQPTKRRDRFDEILGIDTWRKTYNETKSLVSCIKGKIEALQSGIGPLQKQLTVLPELQAQQEQARQQRTETEQQWQQQQQQLQTLNNQLQQLDALEQQIQQLRNEQAGLQGRIENGREMIAGQQESVKAAEQAQQLVSEHQAAWQGYQQAEQQLQQLRQQQLQQRQLEQELADSEKQVAARQAQLEAEGEAIRASEQQLQQEQNQLQQALQELPALEPLQQCAAKLPQLREQSAAVRGQLGQLQGRRDGLREGSEKLASGICPFFQEPCRNLAEAPAEDVFSGKQAELQQQQQALQQQLDTHTAAEMAALQAEKELTRLTAQRNSLEQQLIALQAKRSALQPRSQQLALLREQLQQQQQGLADKRAALAKFASLQGEIEQAEALRAKHQPGRDLYLANRPLAAELESKRQALETYQQHLAGLQTELQQKQQQLKQQEQAYAAERHQQLRQQKEALARELGALEQRRENLQCELERLTREQEKLQQLQAEIERKQAEIARYQEQDQLVKFLRNKVFRNVSAHLSERFREEISQRADRIYRTIAEQDEELSWGENYQIVLRDLVDGQLRERVDDQLSGGQIMSAVVALRLALLQTIGARVAFFDEPTSNLDAARRENLAHAFRAIDVGREELTEHWYDQLFLISHDVAFTEVTDQIIPLAASATSGETPPSGGES